MRHFAHQDGVVIEELEWPEETVTEEEAPEVSNALETTDAGSLLVGVSSDPSAATAASVKAVSAETGGREAFYAALSDKDADLLRTSAGEIRKVERNMILKIGQILVSIRDACPGCFVQWLKVEFDMSTGSAYNYLAAWEKFGSTPVVIDVLPVRTVYKLAAKATPAEVRDAVVNEIVAGAEVSAREVERRIADAREAEKERLAAERKASEVLREKQAAERALESRIKKLKDAGKSEDEIERERKAFKSKENRRERERLKREEEAREQERKNEEARASRQQGALAAANFLRDRLGSDFEAFLSMMAEVGLYEVERAIKELAPVELSAPARTEVTDELELDKAA